MADTVSKDFFLVYFEKSAYYIWWSGIIGVTLSKIKNT